ncbi:MAG: hypothetical protein K1060chlam5_00851 [Candidatus Anoxychlamydiales bacterium]|nr:hypothetical protein [Candidatus Anoxychlamydiales bacterium]
MDLKNLDVCFNRAIKNSFQKKKLILTFFTLFLCSFLFVFASSISFLNSSFARLALLFLPVFLSFTLLFVLGIVLIKIYVNEVKNIKLNFLNLLKDLIFSINKSISLSFSYILVFLILFIIFSIFVFVKEIPHIGAIVGSILSFIPFLIVMLSIILLIANMLTLFFLSPIITLSNIKSLKIIKECYQNFKNNIFLNILFFLIAILPGVFIIILLSISTKITNLSYVIETNIVSFFIKNLIIALQYSIFLTPAIIFFFNFAAEGFNLVKKIEAK